MDSPELARNYSKMKLSDNGFPILAEMSLDINGSYIYALTKNAVTYIGFKLIATVKNTKFHRFTKWRYIIAVCFRHLLNV